MNQGCLRRVLPLRLRLQACAQPVARMPARGLTTESQTEVEAESHHFNEEEYESHHNFPVLNILPYNVAKKEKRLGFQIDTISPRYKRMAINQDWGSAWPTARTFHPASVPLPLHMNYIDDLKPMPPVGKYNNLELMKIPNFLHLTPPVVKRQCEALKKFCTKWPTALQTDEDCDKHYPIKVTTKDFVFSASSLRWADGRVVEMKMKLSDLKLDEHARDKFIRLLRERYDKETDEITIRADSCPLKKQNYDYGQYLITALYFESWKTEPWEAEKEYTDWEKYYWDRSLSRKSITEYLRKVNPAEFGTDQQVIENESVQTYAKAVSDLCTQKEACTPALMNAYKESVLKLLY